MSTVLACYTPCSLAVNASDERLSRRVWSRFCLRKTAEAMKLYGDSWIGCKQVLPSQRKLLLVTEKVWELFVPMSHKVSFHEVPGREAIVRLR
jgi:hypothetical protein